MDLLKVYEDVSIHCSHAGLLPLWERWGRVKFHSCKVWNSIFAPDLLFSVFRSHSLLQDAAESLHFISKSRGFPNAVKLNKVVILREMSKWYICSPRDYFPKCLLVKLKAPAIPFSAPVLFPVIRAKEGLRCLCIPLIDMVWTLGSSAQKSRGAHCFRANNATCATMTTFLC